MQANSDHCRRSPVTLLVGLFGDRALVVFATPDEISPFIKHSAEPIAWEFAGAAFHWHLRTLSFMLRPWCTWQCG